MTEERMEEEQNFLEQKQQMSQQQGWIWNLGFSVWTWIPEWDNLPVEPVWWQQIPYSWINWEPQQQGKKKIDIFDLVILFWLIIFIFILFSIIYTFQWDYIFSIIWLLVFISLFKIFIVSKQWNNNFSILLWFFLFWLYLYFLTYYISFWWFVLPMVLWSFLIIFITYYSNFSFDFWNKKTIQNNIPEQPQENNIQEENVEEDWPIQLWEDITQNYDQEFSMDVEENVSNQLVEKVIALLAKWYNILFSPNTRKIFEFYTIVKTEEVIYPEWLTIDWVWMLDSYSSTTDVDEEEEDENIEDNEEEDNNLDNNNENSILEEEEEESDENTNIESNSSDDDDDEWDW